MDGTSTTSSTCGSGRGSASASSSRGACTGGRGVPRARSAISRWDPATPAIAPCDEGERSRRPRQPRGSYVQPNLLGCRGRPPRRPCSPRPAEATRRRGAQRRPPARADRARASRALSLPPPHPARCAGRGRGAPRRHRHGARDGETGSLRAVVPPWRTHSEVGRPRRGGRTGERRPAGGHGPGPRGPRGTSMRRFVMRIRTRSVAGLACIVVLAAACTAGNSNTSPSSTPTVNVSGSHEPVTLTMWSGFEKPEIDYLGSVVSDFEKQYPWIHVKMVPGKQDTDVLTAIRGGTAPDVAMLTVPDDGVQFCSTGLYVDMGPYIRADHVDLSSLVPEGALAYTANAVKGKPCMLPLLDDAYGLYYNTDMFKKAGITRPPKTYSELFADAKKLTQYN